MLRWKFVVELMWMRGEYGSRRGREKRDFIRAGTAEIGDK